MRTRVWCPGSCGLAASLGTQPCRTVPLLLLLLLLAPPAWCSWWLMGALGLHVSCEHVPGLLGRQRQLCLGHADVMRAVARGTRNWLRECQHQFKNHRWNCSTSTRDQRLFGKAILRSSRESAFVYAISSAGVVHAVARACGRGELRACACGAPEHSSGDFAWAGCRDHVRYATRFARAFVDAKERAEKDARALINLHNNRSGRKAVKRFVSRECKCHGVSGSCSLRTCWHELAELRRSGDFLRRRYDGAVRVALNQDGSGFIVADRHFKQPSKSDLVYSEPSPDYCVQDQDVGSLGTDGRLCNKSSRGTDSCEVMCCGRGYDTRRVTRTKQCECKFRWCCAVRCRECSETVDVHTCKAAGQDV